MNVALWIGQGVLAAIFLVSGFFKSTWSIEEMLRTGQTAAKIVPLPYLRTAGISELFGVAGIILPWLTGIARVLTPLAAVGFAVIMLLAIGVHYRLREPRNIAKNVVIMAVAVAVAVGRFAGL
ncbi:MAG TPA: DoxX family protein [Actinophytocola sp.]|uniref:DoxX family protein n=1 Tax=Actinophytocola sp. TaxID=1872138 RepID=UPI002DBB7EB5|nr:DoxX family protein [Actinophytocola sp.]HEU5475266.1 DoxX family protein [Actinophytocola sp.]